MDFGKVQTNRLTFLDNLITSTLLSPGWSWIGTNYFMPRAVGLFDLWKCRAHLDKKAENSNLKPSKPFQKVLKQKKRKWKSYNFERDRLRKPFHLPKRINRKGKFELNTPLESPAWDAAICLGKATGQKSHSHQKLILYLQIAIPKKFRPQLQIVSIPKCMQNQWTISSQSNAAVLVSDQLNNTLSTPCALLSKRKSTEPIFLMNLFVRGSGHSAGICLAPKHHCFVGKDKSESTRKN